MAKKKVVKKKPKVKAKTRLSLVNFKASGKDRRMLVQLAAKYAKGNLSAYLRHAALNHRPSKGAVIR